MSQERNAVQCRGRISSISNIVLICIVVVCGCRVETELSGRLLLLDYVARRWIMLPKFGIQDLMLWIKYKDGRCRTHYIIKITIEQNGIDFRLLCFALCHGLWDDKPFQAGAYSGVYFTILWWYGILIFSLHLSPPVRDNCINDILKGEISRNTQVWELVPSVPSIKCACRRLDA